MRLIRSTVSCLLAAASLLVARAAQPDGNWDSRFFLPGVQGEVRAIAISGSERYVGGSFTAADNLAVTNIARWNGTNWSALGGGVNGAVNAIAIHGSAVFAGGTFSQAGGVTASVMARWNGANWSAMGGGIGGMRVTALAVDTAGVLYAGGEFTNAGGVAVANIARWNGTNWSALGSGLSNDPYSAWVLALATRGTELFAGGFFTDAGGVSVSCIAKWNGAAWSSLGSGVDDNDYLPQVTALAVSGNDLYVGGAFASAGNMAAANVARWDGANWARLGSGLERYFGDIPVAALVVSGTRLVAGGRFVSASGIAANNLAVWDGADWAELGGGATGEIKSLAVSDADVLVGGTFAVAGQSLPLGLGRWNGSAWSNVSAGGGQGIYGTRSCVQTPSCLGDSIAALAVTGGVTYAAGGFSVSGGVTTHNIACWNGSNWSPLGSGFDGPAFALALRGSDLVAGGSFTLAGAVPASNVARWDGTNWSALGSGVNGAIYAMAVSGSVAYVGGAFSSAGGIIASNLARWDGSAWTAVGGGVNGPVYALAVQGSNLFVGGKFTSAGSIRATNVARWSGATWSALGNGVGGVANLLVRFRPPPVSALAVQGNELYVGGDFAFAGGVPATNIARWDGANWFALGRGLLGVGNFAPPTTVQILVIDGSHLYAGGSFTSANGVAANNLACWDGANWTAFSEGVAVGIYSRPSVQALALTVGGVYVGGHFKFAGGQPASDFSLWHRSVSVHIEHLGNAVKISWPAAIERYVLESAAALPAASWQTITNIPAIEAERAVITTMPAGATRFYRLRKL